LPTKGVALQLIIMNVLVIIRVVCRGPNVDFVQIVSAQAAISFFYMVDKRQKHDPSKIACVRSDILFAKDIARVWHNAK
jgi:hypothetical protein